MANAVPWSIKPDGQVKVLILLHKGDGFWNSKKMHIYILIASTVEVMEVGINERLLQTQTLMTQIHQQGDF